MTLLNGKGSYGMNGNKAVLDSNFLILLSKGKIDWEPLRARYDKLYASIITYIEVYGYNFADEDQKTSLDDVFNYLEIIEVGSEIADQAIIYRKSTTKKIKLPDAVILASAKRADADLITDNYKDFFSIDPSINVISLDGLKVEPKANS